MIDCFLGDALGVLEYCSAVWCSAADTHLRLLDHIVSGDNFLTGGVFDCDLAPLSICGSIMYAVQDRV